MTIGVDSYRVVLRFPRLFPDPAVFEDPKHLASRYLSSNGVPPEKTRLVFQTADEVTAIDDHGMPAVTAGTARYLYAGRTILAEYMSNASVEVSYVDFGSGLTPEQHSRFWGRGKIGELRFELRDFKHNRQPLNLPEVSELYRMLKDRATPSSLSTIELDGVPSDLFDPVVEHVEASLKEHAEADGLEVEVYAARSLSSSEKTALEKRLTRGSSKSTVFIILSRRVERMQSSVT